MNDYLYDGFYLWDQLVARLNKVRFCLKHKSEPIKIMITALVIYAFNKLLSRYGVVLPSYSGALGTQPLCPFDISLVFSDAPG